MRYSKGVMWLDDCRIPTTENLNGGGYGGNNMGTAVYALSDGRKTLPTNKLSKDDYEQPQGRFTPNLLVCDDMLNDGSIGGNNSNKFYEPQYEDTSNIYGKYKQLQVTQYKDKGSSSRYYDLDKWFDKIIDEIQ
jgi:hypothetical protein